MPDGPTAPLPDETNPYASPKAPVDLEWKRLHESEGAWRRGDEMLLAGRKSKTPQACWVSNNSVEVRPCPLSSAPKKLTVLLVLLLGVPGVALAFLNLFAILYILNWLLGWFPEAKCWLCEEVEVRHRAVLFLFLVLIIVGGVGAVVGLSLLLDPPRVGLLPGLITYAAALLAVIGAAWLVAVLPRATLGLTVERQKDGLIHVRGVHPDYLARLPKYPGR